MAITARCNKCGSLLFDTESFETLTNKTIPCAGCGTVYTFKEAADPNAPEPEKDKDGKPVESKDKTDKPKILKSENKGKKQIPDIDIIQGKNKIGKVEIYG
jgi:DNA-directed RNA polymerase subunit M/transcription elongation factor TFIIS